MIKNVIIIVLCFFIFLRSNAQKYSFGVMASPDLTYVNGSFGKNTEGSATYAYGTRPGYTLGLSIYKKISKHFFITSGLWYIDKGTKRYTSFVYLDSNNNVIDTFPGIKTHRYQDLDIPVLINYTFGKTKIKFVCSAGFVFGFALKETVTSSTSYKTNVYNVKENNKGPDRINLNVAIGCSYKINDTYTLLFEPNYKIDVRAIVKTIWDDSHSFGLRTTVIYRFKY